MTEAETWDALRKTALSDHDGWCNYGRTNGREMCTCEVLVNLLEGTDDETSDEALRAAYRGPIRYTAQGPTHSNASGADDSGTDNRVAGASRSEQRTRRLNQRQASSRRKR